MQSDAIDKFECAACHRNARWPGGIIVSPNLKWGVCTTHAAFMPSEEPIFVRFYQERVAKVKNDEEKEPQPKRLAIGLPGGFQVDDDVTYNDVYTACTRAGDGSFVDMATLTEEASTLVAKIADAPDNLSRAMQSTVANMWGGDDRPVSKHADALIQLPDAPKLPAPNARGEWQCQKDGCDVVGNVWLNLSDGAVLCGRRQMLSMTEMQNGNMHALQHYEETGKIYPLVVKLGTIDASGQADVYSYDEDSEVTDPHLKEHLAHFGIDMTRMEKTCRTLEELQVELNLKHDWSAIAGGDGDEKIVYGAMKTGLVNLGNTCYMNSVLQALLHIPDWRRLYTSDMLQQWLMAYSYENMQPMQQLNALLAKLLLSMASGEFSAPPSDTHASWQNGISPLAFRRLIAAGHPEFASSRQQDAEEFLRYILDRFEQEPPPFADGSLTDTFRFRVEQRIRDCVTDKVGYKTNDEVILSLTVDMNRATNKDEYDAYERRLKEMQEKGESVSNIEPVFARVSMSLLLQAAFNEEIIADANSPIDSRPTGLGRRLRMQTMPAYLWVTIRRFAVADDGITIKKLPVDVEGAHELCLETYRAQGAQSNESLLPEEALKRAGNAQVNQEFVDMLVSMGFPLLQAREAVKQTQNAGAEQALNWLLEHPDALPSEDPPTEAGGSGKVAADGAGNYVIKAIVVHLGRNTHSGHYIAFVRQENDEWICYNDEKVYVVANDRVPIGKAYLMLYERM